MNRNSETEARLVNIERVKAHFDISQHTLEQAVRENPSIRNGDLYDLEKLTDWVQNHPKIRAFMSRSNSRNGTAISHGKVINGLQ